jgi:hypothetical protein
MATTNPALERDPGYWWLRLTYAIREQDAQGTEQAQRQLSGLGVDVAIRRADAFREQLHKPEGDNQ